MCDTEINRFTARAPVNIAVIKYWGKKNEDLIIPINDSISATLSIDEMCATTTVACSSSFEKDRMWLNGKEEEITNKRLQNCLREMKKRASKRMAFILEWPVHICSKNNFPTAAGLASSAAGYACLVSALGSLYEIKDDLSIFARQGSGSACRSIYGGFVHWKMGCKDDGTDSIAEPIVDEYHWPEMRVIILVVNAGKKETSSTSGMKETVLTSELIGYRASTVVPKRVKDIRLAILEKDFHKFAEITMKDSNQFHAICLDTYPPIRYMNSISFAVVDMVHKYNSYYGKNKIAYTFDAGPNACLFLLESDMDEVVKLLMRYFPSSSAPCKRYSNVPIPSEISLPSKLKQHMNFEPIQDAFQHIIFTKVGRGSQIEESNSFHLLNEFGWPF